MRESARVRLLIAVHKRTDCEFPSLRPIQCLCPTQSVCITTMYMHAKAHYSRAVKVCAQVRAIDTSRYYMFMCCRYSRDLANAAAVLPDRSPSRDMHLTPCCVFVFVCVCVREQKRRGVVAEERTASSAGRLTGSRVRCRVSHGV